MNPWLGMVLAIDYTYFADIPVLPEVESFVLTKTSTSSSLLSDWN